MNEWWTYRADDFLMFSPRVYARLFERLNEDWWPLHLVLLRAHGVGHRARRRDVGQEGVRVLRHRRVRGHGQVVAEEHRAVGQVTGAVIGAFIMGVMNNGMGIMGINIDWQQVIKGLVLLGAVAFDLYNKKKA